MANTFTWLHLTDLHLGQSRYEHSPDLILSLLLNDLEKLLAGQRLPFPDVVFFTGDLAFSGTEYAPLEAFLGKLWERFRARWGKAPLLAPVPGNHDLSWQRLTPDQRVLWRSFHEKGGEVRSQLFASRRAGLEGASPRAPEAIYWLDALLDRAFSGYVEWLSRTRIPLVQRRPGLLPGEYAATWAQGDLRLGIVGLNSAYYDVPDRPRPGEGSLALYPSQLDGAVGPQSDFASWCAEHDTCIVLSHHPPSWLDPAGHRGLQDLYLGEDRVALQLCGHIHDMKDDQWGSGWDPQTRVFAGRSLFGLEAWETPAGARLERSFGYALGQLRFTPGSAEAKLVVYPRRADTEHSPIKIRTEPSADEDTKALKPQSIPVRPRLPPRPRSSAPPGPGSRSTTFRRPLFDEIFGDISARRAHQDGGVFLFAPTRYGGTTLVGAVLDDLEERRGEGPVDPQAFIVVRVELQDFVNVNLDIGQIQKKLCARIVTRAFKAEGDRQAVPAQFVSECVGEVLAMKPERTLLLLVLESFGSLAPEINGLLQSALRSALDNNKYTSTSKRGFRLLVVSRVPLESTFAVAQPGSMLRPALHAVELGPLSLAEAVQCARRHHLAWQGDDECAGWLWRHTGGHPELYFRLCSELVSLASPWPPLLRAPASDEARTAWLHDEACPLKKAVDTLARSLRTEPPRRDAPTRIPFVERVSARPAGG
jgi:hypothetical protein